MPDKDKNANTTRIPTTAPLQINININTGEESSSYILKYSKGISQQRILIFIICLILFIFYYSISDNNENIKDDNNKKEIEIIQDMDMLTNIIPTEGDGESTAILLNWNRLDNIKIIVKHLCQYSMFKEIFIWNNNIDVHLSDPVK